MRNPCYQKIGELTGFYALSLCFFFLLSFYSTTNCSAADISYADNCASIVAESGPTFRVHIRDRVFPLFDLTTNHYIWGGDKILGELEKSSDPHRRSNFSETYVEFQTTRNVFETTTPGIYKVKAYLEFRLLGAFRRSRRNYSGPGHYYRRGSVFRPVSLRFLLNGFWSEQTRKLCMVGARSWRSGESKSLEFEAVFELNYAKKNSTLFTGLAKGSLRSLSSSNSPSYFEPVEIVSFPVLDDYNYTLGGGCLGGNEDIPPKQSLSLKPTSICSIFQWQSYEFDLEYAAGCKSTSQDYCSPFEGDPAYLSLYAFQCSRNEGNIRFMISFGSERYGRRNRRTFDPHTTLVGEGTWDSKRNQLCIVACRVLSPFKSPGDVSVGDCSMRLSLRVPVVLTLKDTSSLLGLAWTNKTVADPGYFKKFRLRSSDSMNNGVELPGLRYEYTETEKVRELCPRNQVVHKSTGDRYPKGNSYDMRFDMSAANSKGIFSWGRAFPIAVGDELYGQSSVIVMDSVHEAEEEEEEESTSHRGQMNVSYKLTFPAFQNRFFPLNSSLNYRNDLEISAEGIYDAETGHLCMVGCRKIYLNGSEKSPDCEIIMKFQFPPLNSKVGSSIQGIIQSRRAKNDSLYLEPLNISSHSYYAVQAEKTIWRMDLEIVLVLTSNTLLCIFLASQIFYVKKHPEVLTFISLVMLTILTLGHMIPLVLNLEALLLKNHNQQEVVLQEAEGRLELKEMSVRLVNLVAFLLLLRLLQKAWSARMENGDGKKFWDGEKKTFFVTLLLYAVGGIITLLVDWRKNGTGNGMLSSDSIDPQQASTLKYLKSYAGLVLDGFLLPQILLNAFQNSGHKALSCLFYMGTTLVRLLPHAYDLYRLQNYLRQDFNGSFIFANPSADFYSIAWDVIIPCGCVLLAVILWLQQRFGGRCILPRRIRELGSYEKVPAVSNE